MRRGFTLIEVLLGLALLALVISVVQGVYAGVTRSRNRAQEQTEGAHAATLLLQRMADELANASSGPAEGTEASTGLVLGKDADGQSRLDFTTTLPALAPDDESKSPTYAEVYARIEYSVQANDDGTRQLVRGDSRAAARSGGAETEAPDVVIDRVTRFRVTLSPDGKTWEDTWSGPAAGEDTAVPRIAAIEIGWQVGTKDKPQERLLRTAVSLYGVSP
ncbi:MAG: prepilin-type N-terminal cleavage/methylation domain-containing protein [Deltaproteobacteria bacterium]|nr:prepilin-type N-terminal cleavage/methylation domain-containing protein [Deltaproteobacteria bacterium]